MIVLSCLPIWGCGNWTVTRTAASVEVKMEGFRNVDEKNMNQVYQSDGQADWLAWRSGKDGKKHLQNTKLKSVGSIIYCLTNNVN